MHLIDNLNVTLLMWPPYCGRVRLTASSWGARARPTTCSCSTAIIQLCLQIAPHPRSPPARR